MRPISRCSSACAPITRRSSLPGCWGRGTSCMPVQTARCATRPLSCAKCSSTSDPACTRCSTAGNARLSSPRKQVRIMSNVATSEPVSIWQLGAPLGEGPIWVERDEALWFVDIKSHKIHRYDPANGATRSWDAPGQVSFVLPAEKGGFVVGLQTGLSHFDERDGSSTHPCPPEPDKPGNRLNDATVDPAGRLWFGSMDDSEEAITGAIYRLASDGACVATSPLVAITN